MAEEYNPKEIEKKWQAQWLESAAFKTPENPDSGKKRYCLVEFPYPSGDGLHVGHVKIYTAMDIFARYSRMTGHDVLHPMGWDAFGLPTENYAIKTGIHPVEVTKKNTDRFREQMQALGLSYDWEREVNTTDPDYYKWTQWIFLKLFKRGLAYEDTININWCPSCKTGLANEEVVDGNCERCGHEVVQKPMRQWMLKITEYAEQLLAGLPDLDWPDFIKDIQKNWIGRKEGINITYDIKDSSEKVTCFTTRPDTNFGATFVVLAPEHDFSQKIAVENEEVAAYIAEAKKKTDLERQEDAKKKTGAFTGYYAVNHLTGREMPIWVADFVLGHFGTGAVVGVPGHDMRDFEFAQVYDLPILRVVVSSDGDTSEISKPEQVQEKEGKMINSGFLDGMDIHEATEKMKDHMESEGYGQRIVSYSLRDWVFSRQRYWGEPIPVVHCDKCGVVAVPEEELPLKLPEVENYEPSDDGQSPLVKAEDWVNTTCPECDGEAKRETNTMPQWAGSSWYWIRFADPDNQEALASPEAIKNWLPVDVYAGGAEHAVLHLLYARFWNMVLHDEGVVPQAEPFKKRHIVGLVLGSDGVKMSKSRGNVVNPDDEIEKYGADTVRVFSAFMGPFEGSAAWTTEGIAGSERFLKRVWNLFADEKNYVEEVGPEVLLKTEQTLKRVTDSMDNFRFNTAVAGLMELLNELEKSKVTKEIARKFILMLSPLAPHLAAELWSGLGENENLTQEAWPQFDEKAVAAAKIKIPVQVNGKLRGELETEPGLAQEQAEELAKQIDNVAKNLTDKDIKKVIYVPDKLLNFVV